MSSDIESHERRVSPSHHASQVCHIVQRYLCNRHVWFPVCLGQVLSLLICGTGISSQYLASTYQVNVPMLQNFLNYLLLALVFGLKAVMRVATDSQYCSTQTTAQASRNELHFRVVFHFMRTRGWKYVVASLVDVEANYLMVKAFQYTSVTSIMLLDCVSIPTALVLSYFLLAVRYRWTHYGGVATCLAGVVIMFIGDSSTQTSTMSLNPLLGNTLVVAGSVAYGFSNVWQEHLIRGHLMQDYLGFLGIFGALICGVQSIVVEWNEMGMLPHLAVQHGFTLWLFGLTYGLCMFTFYSLMPVVMRASSAVLVNLSLTSSDVYGLLVGIFVFNYQFQYLYFVGYVLIVIGVVAYVLRSPVYLLSNESTTEVQSLSVVKQ